MRSKSLFLLSLLIVVSMVLGACAPAATPDEPAMEEDAPKADENSRCSSSSGNVSSYLKLLPNHVLGFSLTDIIKIAVPEDF